MYYQELEAYSQTVKHIPLLSRDEEAALAERIQGGDIRARNKLVRHNLRFALGAALKYRDQGVPIEDLVQEANTALIRAAERFDPTRGKFISCAVWWIRQQLVKALADNSRAMRLPYNRAVCVAQVVRAYQRVEQRVRRTPTAEEIADDTGISTEDVREALRVCRRPVRLDAPNSISGQPVANNVPGAIDAPDARLDAASDAHRVERMLSSLAPRTQRAVRAYYGIGMGEPWLLRDVGSAIGVHTERARQIIKRGMETLQAQAQAARLRGVACV